MQHTSTVPAAANDWMALSSATHAECKAEARTQLVREAASRFRVPTTRAQENIRMPAMALFLSMLASTAANGDGLPQAVARFSGNAGLAASPQQSANSRYSITAELKADTTQQTGRYALTAQLFADAKTSEGVCAATSDLIFADGFEN